MTLSIGNGFTASSLPSYVPTDINSESYNLNDFSLTATSESTSECEDNFDDQHFNFDLPTAILGTTEMPIKRLSHIVVTFSLHFSLLLLNIDLPPPAIG